MSEPASFDTLPLEVMGMIMVDLSLEDVKHVIQSSKKGLEGLQAQRRTILARAVKNTIAPEA